MKYNFRFLVIILCLLLPVSVKAYTNTPKHHVVLSFSGGYAGYLNDYTFLREMQSSNWELFLGYEYEYQHFITQTGIGARTRFTDVELEDYQTSIFTYDTQGKLFEYAYQFTNRQDQSRQWSLNVPLLAGARYACFYFLTGIINNIHFYEDYSTNVFLTCKGYYDRYVGDFANMDNHAFYANEPLHRKSQKSYIYPRYQLYPYLELGVDLVNIIDKNVHYNSDSDLQVRIAAFTYIAAFNSHTTPTYDSPYTIDKYHPFDLSKLEIPAVCNSHHVAHTFNRDYTLGLKISVLFNVSYGSRYCLKCR